MNKDILQKFIQLNGDYVLGNRYQEGMGANRGNDTWEAIFLSSKVKEKFWVDDIGKLSFDDVEKFADEEIEAVIHLGKTYQPFQYGIRRKDFIQLEKVTCNPMELIIRCYTEDVKDYYKILKIMQELTEPE